MSDIVVVAKNVGEDYTWKRSFRNNRNVKIQVLITGNGICIQLTTWLTIFYQLIHETSVIMFSLSPKLQERVKSNIEKRRWWLFNAKDFQSLMYPCFIFCRILGILPYRINASSFKTSKLDYILSTVVTCFFCLCALIKIYDNISVYLFESILEAIEANFFYMLGCFIMIVTFVLRGSRLRLVQTIQKISSILPSESYSKQSILIHAKDIFGVFILIVQSFSWLSKKLSIIFYVMTLYIVLLEFQMDMLYVNCVCVLKTCLKKINDDLANLLIMHDEPHSVMQVYNKQKKTVLLMKLNAIKKRHLIVSETMQRLKMIFSPQLLANIATAFIEITIGLYYGMVEWDNGLSIGLNRQMFHTYVLFYITFDVAKITLIAWACETGKNQTVKISNTIHDVLNSTNDEQLKYELYLFGLQIMHCDNTFSAKGLSLDANLITAMVGTIATYLLILIQFLITTHSCNGRTGINITQAIS